MSGKFAILKMNARPHPGPLPQESGEHLAQCDARTTSWFEFRHNSSRFSQSGLRSAATGVFCVALLFAWNCVAAEDAIVPTKRIELFNGKDLTGWKLYLKDETADVNKTWSVENGVIKNTGKPIGYMRTEQSFKNYKLTVEWRFTKIAPKADNTGVLVHMESADKLWPQCVQCQGQHGKQGDMFVMAGAECKEHQGMGMNTPVPRQGPSTEKEVGEWNTCEMTCTGDDVKAYINGKFANGITKCTVTAGRIGIQSEGGEIEIRKIFVEPLGK